MFYGIKFLNFKFFELFEDFEQINMEYTRNIQNKH